MVRASNRNNNGGFLIVALQNNAVTPSHGDMCSTQRFRLFETNFHGTVVSPSWRRLCDFPPFDNVPIWSRETEFHASQHHLLKAVEAPVSSVQTLASTSMVAAAAPAAAAEATSSTEAAAPAPPAEGPPAAMAEAMGASGGILHSIIQSGE